MYSHISQFFSGELDPFWPHVWLLGGSIVGGALVGLGVILEAPKIFSIPTAAVFLGVVIESASTLLLFGFDEGISAKQQADLNTARSDDAKAGLIIGALSGTLEGVQGRISRNELAIRDLQEGTRTPPTPIPPSVQPPSSATYVLTDDAKLIIRQTTLPGAIISIIPFMPALERFAADLGQTFASIPAVQVAVGQGNVILNGQTGLIVQYDHGNRVSSSVFEALAKAGLNPVDGPPTPGTPIVFIKVAPPP